jgi:hypothetical protein
MTSATHHANETLTIHLKVKDYATWRTGYDGREKSRLSAGNYSTKRGSQGVACQRGFADSEP